MPVSLCEYQGHPRQGNASLNGKGPPGSYVGGDSTPLRGHGHEALGAVPGTEQSLTVWWQQLLPLLFLLLRSGL